MRDPRLGDALKGRGVAALLHFAFIVDPLYDEREMTDIDVRGTRNVLDAVAAAEIGYLLATSDLAMKKKALTKLDPPRRRPTRFRAPDRLRALLEGL